MEHLSEIELRYVQKFTALLRELHTVKCIDITNGEALHAALVDLDVVAVKEPYKTLQKAIIDEAVQHLTRTLN
jgi:hypothetical protein